MNAHLMNPEIVIRLAYEREQERIREIRSTGASQFETPAAPLVRTRKHRRTTTFIAWLLALVTH